MYRINKIIAAAILLPAVLLTGCGDDETTSRAVFTPDVENQTAQNTENNSDATQETGEFEEFLPGEENWGETVSETTAYVNDSTTALALMSAVSTALGDDFLPDTQEKSLETLLITSDMYDDYAYMTASAEDVADEIIIIKSKDDKISEVVDKLNQYRDSGINDYNISDDDIIKVQCSQVISIGDYAAYIQLGADTGTRAETSLKNATDDEKAQAQMDAIDKQNNLAVAAITDMLVR